MNRRQFFRLGVAAFAAPAIVRAESLMPIYVPPRLILFGDGIHDDWKAAQAVLDGMAVYDTSGRAISSLSGRRLLLSRGLLVHRCGTVIERCDIRYQPVIDEPAFTVGKIQFSRIEGVSIRTRAKQ